MLERRRSGYRCALIAPLLVLSLPPLTAISAEGQTVAHVRDTVYPGSRVKALFELGRSVSRLRHVGTQWVVVMPEISGSLVSDTVFPRDAIQERWNQFAITDVTYAHPWWVVAMTRGTTLHDQRYVSADTFPKDFIERGWEERRQITSVAFGKGRYVVVMSKGTGYRRQRWVIRDSLPVSWIKEVWNEGYHVTGLTHVNGRWFVVASVEKFRPQQYAYAYRWPHHTVDSLIDVGYEVTDAAYGDSVYFVVLTRFGDDRPMMSPRSSQAPENSTHVATSAPAQTDAPPAERQSEAPAQSCSIRKRRRQRNARPAREEASRPRRRTFGLRRRQRRPLLVRPRTAGGLSRRPRPLQRSRRLRQRHVTEHGVGRAGHSPATGVIVPLRW